MPNRKIEEQIELLNLLCESAPAEAAAGLRKALGNRVNLVAAKAAKLIAEKQLHDLIPDLLAAFDRLFVNPVERDPQCWGKNAIAKALTALDYRRSAPYLRGIRHVQMEPVWGGQQDTAQTLRGICLLGLVTCTDVSRGEVLRCLVDALAESESVVRIEAVRALAEMEGEEAAVLLRLKARMGDEEASVTGQVFDAVLKVEREAALGFVAQFLSARGGDVSEEAALALGSSRVPGATVLLQDTWKDARDPQFREVLLRALSASRQESSIEFLLDLIRNGRPPDAACAIEMLALHRSTPEIKRSVEAMVREHRAHLQDLFRKFFEE